MTAWKPLAEIIDESKGFMLKSPSASVRSWPSSFSALRIASAKSRLSYFKDSSG